MSRCYALFAEMAMYPDAKDVLLSLTSDSLAEETQENKRRYKKEIDSTAQILSTQAIKLNRAFETLTKGQSNKTQEKLDEETRKKHQQMLRNSLKGMFQ